GGGVWWGGVVVVGGGGGRRNRRTKRAFTPFDDFRPWCVTHARNSDTCCMASHPSRSIVQGTRITRGREAVAGSTFAIRVARGPRVLIDVISTSTRRAAAVATCTGITFCEQ